MSEGKYQESTADPAPPEPEPVRPQSAALVPLDLARLYAGAAQKRVDETAQKLLATRVPEEWVEILPTGELHLPNVLYRKLLNQAFGPMGWALLRTNVMVKENLALWDGALHIDGRFAAIATGEAEYYPSNKRMSYGSAVESAKSDCLKRCCKDLGIAAELWDKHYCEEWKAKHAERVWDDVWNNQERRYEKRQVWKKKGSTPAQETEGSGTQRPSSPESRAPSSSPAPASAATAPGPSSRSGTQHAGTLVFGFGKFKGKRIMDVKPEELRGYQHWLRENTNKQDWVGYIQDWLAECDPNFKPSASPAPAEDDLGDLNAEADVAAEDFR